MYLWFQNKKYGKFATRDNVNDNAKPNTMQKPKIMLGSEKKKIILA